MTPRFDVSKDININFMNNIENLLVLNYFKYLLVLKNELHLFLF